LLALAFTTACNFNRSKVPATNNGNTSSHGTAFTPGSDARKDLREALERLKTAFPYRLTENSSGTADGRELPAGTRVVEFATADRTHTTWTNGPAGNSELITIGDQRYSRSNNGNWTVGSLPGLAQRQAMEKRMRELMASAFKDVQYVGTDTINGVPCHAYTYTMEMDLSGQKSTVTGKAWIGSGDGLPRQIDSETTIGSFKQKSHITYEFNADFKVEKPVM
jgi:hypothetical protein